MKVLVACEFSGIVRDAFIARGHDAISCDLLPTERPGPHVEGDVRELLKQSWDLVIAHPPCTYFTTTGARWFYHPDDKHLPTAERRPHPSYPNRRADRENMRQFFMQFVDCAPRWAIENPIGYMSSAYRKPDQIIQPWWFGDDASKATCLWLHNLPKLVATKPVQVSKLTTSTGVTFSRWYWETSRGKGAERQKMRSRTFEGIANAMADQWGAA